MMPLPNVIAGVLIGVANDSWLPRLIVPFIWGVVFCVYTSIARQDKREDFVAQAEMRDKKAKWGMSHTQAFYFIEYGTATVTSLIFSIIAGGIKSLFY
jgi:hypothetical protein